MKAFNETVRISLSKVNGANAAVVRWISTVHGMREIPFPEHCRMDLPPRQHNDEV